MVKKIIGKLELLYIKNVLAFLNPVKYEKKYRNWLSSRGVVFKGTPDHIDRTAYFDSADYSKIVIGNQTVISRNVLLLTHDYSITNALRMIGIHTWHNGGSAHVQGKIEIGDNSFIGANAIILPNTYIGNNCIIGGGV